MSKTALRLAKEARERFWGPRTCSTCLFFQILVTEYEAGECRKALPVVSPIGRFPAVAAKDWCDSWDSAADAVVNKGDP